MKFKFRKRKQCTKCFKTFYKAKETNDQFENVYYISPCCNEDYIIV